MRLSPRLAALAVMISAPLMAAAVPFRIVAQEQCAGGMAVGATCVTYATAADGGPSGGTIRLVGIPPGAGIRLALLYWTVLSNVTPVTTGLPTFDGVPLVATHLGEFDGSPCLPETPRTGGFRADVTPLVPGDGTYVIANFPVNSGPNRWTVEGATLLVVYDNTGEPTSSVVILDGLDVTTADGEEIEADITGFTAAFVPGVSAAFAMAAGNGQNFADDVDPLYFNGTDLRARYPSLLSGGACPASDEFSLYDLSLFDVTGFVMPGDRSANIRLVTHVDCYSVVALALAVAENPVTVDEPSALDLVPGSEPLRVTKGPPGLLELTWEDIGAPEYQVYRGWIDFYYTHGPELCGLTLPRAEVAMGTRSDYFLVAAASCTRTVSSCGRTSFGIDRPGTMDVTGTRCP